jgi:hypothetical protein
MTANSALTTDMAAIECGSGTGASLSSAFVS